MVNSGQDELIVMKGSGTEKAITNVANNGSGAYRITSAGHGLPVRGWIYIFSGDLPFSAVGWFVMDKVDANTFDLVGSTYAAGWTSGGVFEQIVPIESSVKVLQVQLDQAIESVSGEFQILVDNFDTDLDGVGDATGFFGLYQSIRIFFNNDSDDVKTLIFTGRIEDIAPRKNKKSGRDEILISGVSYTSELMASMIFAEEYTTQKRSVIVKDIRDKYSTRIIKDNTYIQDSGDSISRDISGIYAWDALIELADDKGWSLFVDVNNLLHFHERKFVPSGNTITQGTDFILEWDFPDTGSQIVNRVTVYGKTPIVVRVDNTTSQSLYGTAENPLIREKIVIDESIETDTEAAERGNNILTRYAFSYKKGEIKLSNETDSTSVDYPTLMPGEVISLTGFDLLGISGNYVIMGKTVVKFPLLVELSLQEKSMGVEGRIADDIRELRKMRSTTMAAVLSATRLVQGSSKHAFTVTYDILEQTEISFKWGRSHYGTTGNYNQWGNAAADPWVSVL
jgi:hypothetical protein